MHAVTSGSLVPEQEETTRQVVYTTLYDLIAAVGDAVEPGKRTWWPPLSPTCCVLVARTFSATSMWRCSGMIRPQRVWKPRKAACWCRPRSTREVVYPH